MIVYEVNLHVDAIAADEYTEWLGPHIEQILDIQGFHKAEWFVCDSEDDINTHCHAVNSWFLGTRWHI